MDTVREPKVQDDQLWLVTVEQVRIATFWVKAETREAAKEDADELGCDILDWDNIEDDVEVTHAPRIVRRPKAGDVIWSGGPDGNWIDA